MRRKEKDGEEGVDKTGYKKRKRMEKNTEITKRTRERGGEGKRRGEERESEGERAKGKEHSPSPSFCHAFSLWSVPNAR